LRRARCRFERIERKRVIALAEVPKVATELCVLTDNLTRVLGIVGIKLRMAAIKA
jgi:hypothetical protein